MSLPLSEMRDQLGSAPPRIVGGGVGPSFLARIPISVDLLGGDVRFAGGMSLSVPTLAAAFAVARLDAASEVQVDGPAETLDGAVRIAKSIQSRSSRAEGVRVWVAPPQPFDPRAPYCIASQVAVEAAVAAAYQYERSPDAQVERVFEIAHDASPLLTRADVRSVVGATAGHLLPILAQPDQAYPLLPFPADFEPVLFSAEDEWSPSSPRPILRTSVAMAYRMIAERMGLRVTTGERGAPQTIEDPFFEGYFTNIDPVTFASEFRDNLPDQQDGSDFLERWGGVGDAAVRVEADVVYPIKEAAIYAISEHHRACVAIDALSRDPGEGGASVIFGAQLEQAYLMEREFSSISPASEFLTTELRKRGGDRGVFGVRSSVAGGAVVAIVAATERGRRAVAESTAALEREFGRTVNTRFGTSAAGVAQF